MSTLFQRASLPPRIGACLMLTASLAIASAAAAQSNGIHSNDIDAPRVNVSYADLNLRSEAGAQVMMARIEDAAERVCGGAPDTRLLDRRALFNSCKAKTFDRAVRELHAPLVTAMAGDKGIQLVLAGR